MGLHLIDLASHLGKTGLVGHHNNAPFHSPPLTNLELKQEF